MDDKQTPYHCFNINDIWQIQSLFDTSQAKFLQWSSGNLQGSRQQLNLGDLVIYRNVCNRGLMAEFEQPKDCLTLSFFQRASGSVNWQGDELNQDEVMIISPGIDASYRLPEYWWNIEIDIHQPLFETLGLVDESAEVQSFKTTKSITIKKQYQSLLVGFIINTLRMSTETPQLLNSKAWMRQVKVQLLIYLQQAFSDYIVASCNNLNQRQEMGKRIAKLIASYVQLNLPLNIEELAIELATHERNIYRITNDQTGMSPYAYYQLIRLHKFREALHNSDGSHGTVTRCAINSGVDNISRLTSQFCKQFGETPRQYLNFIHK